MIYLDHGATSWPKPWQVREAVSRALVSCGNPGRGGYSLSMAGAGTVYECRKSAGEFFSCREEQVVCTSSCTHGLNLAIRSLVKPGDKVLITGFEHNAVTRTLYGIGANVITAEGRLFHPEELIESFSRLLREHPKAAVFTCVSNVFGYILPIGELAALCRRYEVPFVLDGAQAAGHMELNFTELGAAYLAVPGHKGLLGPMGTGLLLCGKCPEPLVLGGTGSLSASMDMPDFLPDRAEAGTLNVPGIAGLTAGMKLVRSYGVKQIGKEEAQLTALAGEGLEALGCRVFRGKQQAGCLSFLVPGKDCEWVAEELGMQGICTRAGLHCAPLAHKTAGTLETGTVRISFGYGQREADVQELLGAMREILTTGG